MAYIYKITNMVNGKIYIGETTHTVEKRWQEHLSKINQSNEINRKKHSFAIHAALRKYGKENFTIETIEQCSDADRFERETYWIKYYDSYKNGYNLTLGGEGSIKYDKKQFKELWDKGFSTEEIAKQFGCSTNTVYYGLSIFEGFSEEAVKRRTQNAVKGMKENHINKVDCYDLQGNFLKTYNSQREASRELSIQESGISVSIKTGGRVTKYMFVNYGDNPPKPYSKTGSKPVIQLDLNGNYIQEFKSARAASDSLGKGKAGGSSIGVVCNGKRQSAYGYKWKWKEKEQI